MLQCFCRSRGKSAEAVECECDDGQDQQGPFGFLGLQACHCDPWHCQAGRLIGQQVGAQSGTLALALGCLKGRTGPSLQDTCLRVIVCVGLAALTSVSQDTAARWFDLLKCACAWLAAGTFRQAKGYHSAHLHCRCLCLWS